MEEKDCNCDQALELKAALRDMLDEFSEIAHSEFGTHRNPDGMSDDQRERFNRYYRLAGPSPQALEAVDATK